MRFNTTVRGKLRVSDALQERIEKKLSKLEKFFAGDTEVYLVFSETRLGEKIEVTIKYGSLIIRGQKEDEDLLTATDGVVDLLERQIRKNKTRLEKRLREGAFSGKDEKPEKEDTYSVVKIKKFDVKPMDVEEAILQMNMLGHQFFLYEDSETERACVVYRRNDGDYGLIEAAR